MTISSSVFSSLNSSSSGLDVKSIVADLVAAQKAPMSKKLEKKESGVRQQISAYGQLKNKLSDLKEKISLLKTEDASALEGKVSDFVSAFNAFKTKLNEYTEYNSTTKVKGIFFGKSIAHNLKNLFSDELTTAVSGLSENYRALSDIGITTKTNDGTLLLDTEKLNAALDANFTAVNNIFSATGTGKIETLNSLIDRFMQSTGFIAQSTASANNQLASIGSQRDMLNKKMEAYEARLMKQFNAMNKTVLVLKSQSDFLTQAFAGLSAK